jgi:hypothetical protein
MLRGMATQLEILADELHVNGNLPAFVFMFSLFIQFDFKFAALAPVPPDHHIRAEEMPAVSSAFLPPDHHIRAEEMPKHQGC